MGRELGGDGVVAFEGIADVVGGDGTFAADAPVITAQLDDGGRQHVGSFAGVEDQRKAIAELGEDFDAAGAGGRAGKIGASAGERDAEFGDEINDDFGLGPAESDAASVGGDFQGKAVRGVNDDGERPGPAGLGETKEIVRKIFREDLGVDQRANENRKSAMLGTALDAKDFFDGGEIDRVGGESVKRIGGDGDDRTAI